jgi:hypothetical protein
MRQGATANLDTPARAGPSEARVGMKKQALGRTKKLMKEEKMRRS